MAEVTWRYARPTDIATFFEGPIGPTVRAVVVEVNGEPQGLIGMASDGVGRQCFFSEERPGMAAHRRRLPALRAIQRVMQWVREAPVPVYSISDNRCLLERLGFQHLKEDVYVWLR